MHRATVDLEGLLRALYAQEIAFVIVGGAAAVLHGAPTTTQDLDIVPEQSEANLDRLLALLQAHETVVRDPLRGRGQLQLLTDLGPLDVLCRLHDGRGYEDLAPRSVTIEAGDLRLRVLDLPTLIEVKSTTGRVRDRMVVPLLLALLREREEPPRR
jgi:hypothetical protein